ncbi:MAG: MaoC family dehydratase [Acidimicrobiia bacterium]|nr:MaoC family dehydratase [Acidimicrobiia bacterium]
MERSNLSDLVGQELGVSDWFEITQDRIDAFAECTEDRQWIHVDPERAADGPFGATIAHGYLTLSLVSAVLAQVRRSDDADMTVNYGADRIRFISPVPVGSRVRGRVELTKLDELDDGVLHLLQTVTMEIEGSEKPAMVAEVLTRMY